VINISLMSKIKANLLKKLLKKIKITMMKLNKKILMNNN